MTIADTHAAYFDQVPATHRAALVALAERVAARLPQAEPVMSYAMPSWRVPAPKGTKVAAGVAAFKTHIGFYPHSGSIIPQLAERLDRAAIAHSKSGVTFAPTASLPDWVLDEVIRLRLAEIG